MTDRTSVGQKATARDLADLDVVQEVIRQLWAERFPREEISGETNFFELGGRSRELMMLAFAVEERFDVELSLRELVNGPTVAQMAVLVCQRAVAS